MFSLLEQQSRFLHESRSLTFKSSQELFYFAIIANLWVLTRSNDTAAHAPTLPPQWILLFHGECGRGKNLLPTGCWSIRRRSVRINPSASSVDDLSWACAVIILFSFFGTWLVLPHRYRGGFTLSVQGGAACLRPYAFLWHEGFGSACFNTWHVSCTQNESPIERAFVEKKNVNTKCFLHNFPHTHTHTSRPPGKINLKKEMLMNVMRYWTGDVQCSICSKLRRWLGVYLRYFRPSLKVLNIYNPLGLSSITSIWGCPLSLHSRPECSWSANENGINDHSYSFGGWRRKRVIGCVCCATMSEES